MRKWIVAALVLVGLAAGASAHTVTPGTISMHSLGTYVSATPISAISTTTLKAEIDKCVAEGIGTIRFNSDVAGAWETSPGVWNQTELDEFLFKVNLATAAGLDVLITVPINNSVVTTYTLVASSVGATSHMLGVDVAVPFTHIPIADLSWHWRLSRKLAETIGASNHVFWEIWNEPDLDYFFYTGANLPPSTSWYNMIGSTDTHAIKSVIPDAVVMMGGIAYPQGYGTMLGANTFYTGGSFIEQAVVDSTPIASWSAKLNLHCYQDAGCSPSLAYSTMTASVPAMVAKGMWMTETAPYGTATYPNNAAFDEDRKKYWIIVSGAQALGSLGFERWFWHTLDYGDFALFTPGLTDLACAPAWRTFVSGLTGATFLSWKNTSTAYVMKWQQSNGLPVYVTWAVSSNTVPRIDPWPHFADKLAVDGSSVHGVPADWLDLTLSTFPYIFKARQPFGVQTGRH